MEEIVLTTAAEEWDGAKANLIDENVSQKSDDAHHRKHRQFVL